VLVAILLVLFSPLFTPVGEATYRVLARNRTVWPRIAIVFPDKSASTMSGALLGAAVTLLRHPSRLRQVPGRPSDPVVVATHDKA